MMIKTMQMIFLVGMIHEPLDLEDNSCPLISNMSMKI